MDLDELQRPPDLFPFVLPDLKPLLLESDAVELHREGTRRWVARSENPSPREMPAAIRQK